MGKTVSKMTVREVMVREMTVRELSVREVSVREVSVREVSGHHNIHVGIVLLVYHIIHAYNTIALSYIEQIENRWHIAIGVCMFR